mmetsp:Transcript_46244/g.100272  ORF Transcript_46244/g.100272 Transcript_46244/m.100272 type:complete len:229 (+) Transcript_46244:1224-1910(+)
MPGEMTAVVGKGVAVPCKHHAPGIVEQRELGSDNKMYVTRADDPSASPDPLARGDGVHETEAVSSSSASFKITMGQAMVPQPTGGLTTSGTVLSRLTVVASPIPTPSASAATAGKSRSDSKLSSKSTPVLPPLQTTHLRLISHILNATLFSRRPTLVLTRWPSHSVPRADTLSRPRDRPHSSLPGFRVSTPTTSPPPRDVRALPMQNGPNEMSGGSRRRRRGPSRRWG